jgi:uncharacterized membrane protein
MSRFRQCQGANTLNILGFIVVVLTVIHFIKEPGYFHIIPFSIGLKMAFSKA